MGEPKLCQHGLFAGCFDPFGHRFQAKPFRQRKNGRADPLLAGVFVDPRHKAAVDLQTPQGEAPDIGKRGLTGAEIIQIDPAAHVGQRRDVAHDHVIVRLGNDRFQNFNRQPPRLQMKAVQRPSDPFRQLRTAQFLGREIDRHMRDGQPGLVPAGDCLQRVVQDHHAQLFQQAGPLQRGKKDPGGDQAALGVVPAGQGLEPADFAGIGGNLRLEMCADLSLIQGGFQQVTLGVPICGDLAHVRGIAADCAGAALPGGIHSHHGGLIQRAPRGVCRAARHAEADGTGDIDLGCVQHQGRTDRPLQAGGHLHQGFKIKLPHRPQRHDEAAVIQPRQGIAVPQDAGDTLHAGPHRVICCRFAKAAGQPIHVIEPHGKTGRRQACCRADAQNGIQRGDDLRRRHQPAGGAADGCQKVCFAQRHRPEQPDHHGQTQGRQDERALAPQPERRQRQRRKKDHHFGAPQHGPDPHENAPGRQSQ